MSETFPSYPVWLLLAPCIASSAGFAGAQQAAGVEAQPSSSANQAPQVSERIEVEPVSSDRAILKRLSSILKATGWFGREVLRKLAGNNLNRLSRKLARRGWLTVALLGMVPIAPSPWSIWWQGPRIFRPARS